MITAIAEIKICFKLKGNCLLVNLYAIYMCKPKYNAYVNAVAYTAA